MAGVDDAPAKATVKGSSERPGTALVSISGELDLSSVPGVEVELEPIVMQARDRIVFDLSQVSFVDSSGIAMLLRVSGRVASVEIRNPSTSVQLVISATGLADVFAIDS